MSYLLIAPRRKLRSQEIHSLAQDQPARQRYRGCPQQFLPFNLSQGSATTEWNSPTGPAPHLPSPLLQVYLPKSQSLEKNLLTTQVVEFSISGQNHPQSNPETLILAA